MLIDDLCCVLAVHNEEKYLPYSLQSISDLGCKVVVVLDRCSDSSETIVNHCLSNAEIFCKQRSEWSYSCAEAKRVGCEIAKKMGAKIILMSDADVIIDVHAVKKGLELISVFGCVAFGYKQYSLFGSVFLRIVDEIQNLFNNVSHKLGVHPLKSGIYLVRAENAMQPIVTDAKPRAQKRLI